MSAVIVGVSVAAMALFLGSVVSIATAVTRIADTLEQMERRGR